MIVAGKYQISPKTGQDHEKHHKLARIMKDIPQNWPGSWHGPEPCLDTGPLGHDAAAIVPHPGPVPATIMLLAHDHAAWAPGRGRAVIRQRSPRLDDWLRGCVLGVE
jgi:hypothetical protein